MKSIIIYVWIFTSFTIFCQNGKITYEANMLPFEYDKKINNDTISEIQKKYLKNIFNNQPKVLYSLIFNANKSFFEKLKVMHDYERTINIAARKIGKGVYYRNKLSNETINKKFFSGEDFLIVIPDFTWKLKQESKNIGEYTCFKATTTKYVEGRNGKMERKVIAWYTPEIPYNFGPKDYNGLPGLILELQEDNLLISASKISIKLKEKKLIKTPTQGKKVTLREYDSIVKAIYYKRRNRN